MKSAGSLRFELGRGGGERTFSLDFERLSSMVFASDRGSSSNGAKRLVLRFSDSLREDCGRELLDGVMGSGGSTGVGIG